jgi:hypothetical protein
MAPPEVVSTVPFPPAVKERPILFSAPMVRALLDGTKTQTRRVACKGTIPAQYINAREYAPGRWRLFDAEHPDASLAQYTMPPCPYGQPGDRLWVREAIRLVPDQEPDDGTGRVLSTYGADGALTVADAWPWKRSYLPPMHCPRGLSRIDLEVAGVRVERLQDISEADALAEGIDMESDYASLCLSIAAAASYPNDLPRGSAAVAVYKALWEQINGAGSWAANPFVWVVEFKAVRL